VIIAYRASVAPDQLLPVELKCCYIVRAVLTKLVIGNGRLLLGPNYLLCE
jgi:hypothetical protein